MSYQKTMQSKKFRYKDDRDMFHRYLNDMLNLAYWQLWGIVIIIILGVGIFIRLLLL